MGEIILSIYYGGTIALVAAWAYFKLKKEYAQILDKDKKLEPSKLNRAGE